MKHRRKTVEELRHIARAYDIKIREASGPVLREHWEGKKRGVERMIQDIQHVVRVEGSQNVIQFGEAG